jgi:glycosyltransferase involved in cell wall biosynthesis
LIRISVVTPSFNQGGFVERTIQSVLQQDYPGLEYIVCDGGSSDTTFDVLLRYTDRLRAIVEPDRGQADAVNKGIRASSGEVIGWLNSDDLYRAGALITVGAYFQRKPNVDVLYGDAAFIDDSDAVIGRYYTRPWCRSLLPRRPFLCQPAVFFRRRVVERFGPLDDELQYNIDYEYWLRLASGGARFAYVPWTLASSRIHPQAKTSTGGLRIHEELDVMLKRYVAHIPDAWILTHTHAILREQSPAGFHTPLQFALAVSLTSLRLSLHTNGQVSTWLALSTLRTLTAGVVKTALGLPVVAPTS